MMHAWRSKCRAAKAKVACLRSSSFARNKKKDGYTEAEFVNLTLKAFDKVENFLRPVIYTDEANYHKSGHVKWNTHGAWRQKRRYDIYEHAWDSSKVNVRWSKTRDFATGPFIIAEKNIWSWDISEYVKVICVSVRWYYWMRRKRWNFASTGQQSTPLQSWPMKRPESHV